MEFNILYNTVTVNDKKKLFDFDFLMGEPTIFLFKTGICSNQRNGIWLFFFTC